MVDQLARAIYGTTGNNDNGLVLLARTSDVSVQDADEWRAAAALEPLPANGVFDGETVGLFKTYAHEFIVAQARYTNGNPLYIYTYVPRPMMQRTGGNVKPLFAQLPANSKDTLPALTALTPVLNGNDWTQADRAAALQDLLAQFDGDFLQVASLLNAALNGTGLLIAKHDGKTDERLRIVQGMMALLPSSLRADLTFSTYTPNLTDLSNVRVAFGGAKKTARYMLDWPQRQTKLQEVTWSPYMELLAGFWQGQVAALLEMIDQLEPLAVHSANNGLSAVLDAITKRYHFHNRVLAEDDTVTVDDLKEALSESDKLPTDWRRYYVEMLLGYALENKDPEANTIIAAQMDSDSELDVKLQTQMSDMLQEVPDLVYVFMRQRLGEGIDQRWLSRLHAAAQSSMQLALDSGNTDLIASWLRLIAREPDRFQLDGVLRDGLYASVPFGQEDGEFGLTLLVIAARFAEDVLDELLADAPLIRALPDPYPAAFTDYDRDALAELQTQSTSLFLAGVHRAAKARVGKAFEAGMIERLWTLRDGSKKYNTEAPYTPTAILQMCATTGAEWMPSTSLETLLMVALEERGEKLFSLLTVHLSEHSLLSVHLAGALIRGSMNVNRALDTISTLVSPSKLNTADALAVYVKLLESWGWNEETQPIMESAARLLMQNADLMLSANRLNRMLNTAASLRDEASARAAALHLLDVYQEEDDDVFVKEVQRIFSLLAWSQTAREAALNWWRKFAQVQPTARLTRLDKGLEGTRVTEDALQTLRSVAALRRLIGNRDMATFAQDVNTAYKIMETLAESFEPSEKSSSVSFEPQTVRAVLADAMQELSPHQRQILSNSLKGLANLIAQMGDSRTKAGIGRNTANLNRQFMTGEQTPQSAVDAMKWIAGYFSGAQNQDEDK